MTATHPTDKGASTDSYSRVPVSGGTLVYEPDGLGKRLVGFEDVRDWDALADAVAARGHERGAALHLPELDRDR